MSPRTHGVLLIAAAALLWSTGGIGIKGIPDTALKVAFYRSAIATVFLLVWFRPRIPRWSAVFVGSIVSYAACLVSFVVATKWTTAANAIFLQYAGVVWVLLLAPVLLKEPFRRKDAIAVVAALAGMALFFAGRFEARGMNGNLMAIVSSLFFAMLILSLRRLRDVGAEAAVTYGNVVTAAVLLPFVAGDLTLTVRSSAVLIFLGVVQIALAYILFVAGLEQVTATQASLTGMIEPIANPIWVFLVLGERPSGFALAGACIVLAAIAWRTVAVGPEGELPPVD